MYLFVLMYNYFLCRFCNRRISSTITTENIQNYINNCFSNNDPPVPQGATKFSYSATISNCKILVCDTGLDFLDIKVSCFNFT